MTTVDGADNNDTAAESYLVCSSSASCRYLSFALVAAGALVAVVIPSAAPAAAGQLPCLFSSPWLASVKDMDDNDNDINDFDKDAGGLWGGN